VRIRNDGRADNGGMERSLVGCLARDAEVSIELSKFNGGRMDGIADERETGRDGGSMDIVRESVLPRISVLLLRRGS
jgi:hypothetical protein